MEDPKYGPGGVSSGFYGIAKAVWTSGLERTVKAEAREGARNIAVAGASLGGGVGQLLSIRILVSLEAAHALFFACCISNGQQHT